MRLEDEEIQKVIAAKMNANMHVPLDGTVRVEGICKDIADGVYRAWAAATSGESVTGKWQHVIMVSIHKTEPPSANDGANCHAYKNEPYWKAY